MANPLRILSRPAVVLALLGLAPAVAGAQGVMPLPIVAASEPFVSERDIKVYRVDLGTLPERGALRVQVTPDAAHPDLETEITIGNWALDFTGPGFFCIYSSTYADSATGVGVNVLEAVNEIVQCDPRTATFPFNWSGSTVDVQIRVTDFGQAGAGADADILIRGVTKVPTRDLFEAVETDLSLQTAYFEASKDTVLYQRNSSFSNGLGQYLWGGMDYTLIGPPFNLVFRQRLNSLLAFPLLSSSSPIPFNADIVDASLSLYAWEVLNGGGSFTLFETAADPSGATWSEGNADADFPEFAGAQATNFAATASHRQRSPSTSLYPWDSSGGDVAGLQLAVETVTTTGFTTFSSSALANAVQGMIDRGNANDGFLLRGPYSLFGTQDIGVRFASRNYTSPFYTPSLRVDYVPSNPYTDGSFNPGVVSFISEGENFRWIYDTDEDDVLLTSIGGVCDATEPDFVNNLPYTYEFTGAPGYTGLDCCAWQVESQQTGTVGAGQALFFHNLDPLNPANLPPDSDGDGIFDPCDNCPTVPNGPALGSCAGPSGVAGTCLSQADCAAGLTCQFAQQDADFDFAGDVCSVPEPGFGAGLAAASGLLAAYTRRRRRSADPRRVRLALGWLCAALLVLPALARAQLALPVDVPFALFGAPGATRSYTIDLDTLPARPRLVVDVEVGSGSPASVFEIELTGFTGLPADPFPFSIGCPLTSDPSGGWTSGPMLGGARLEADLFFCDPLLNTWNGIDAEVIVRAVDLGQQGLPATVSIRIEGVTFVPTELLVQQVMGPRSVTVTADQDTVIYGDDLDASNGAGDFLWSGTRVVPFLGAPGVYFRYPRKSLLKFGGLSTVLPPNALVNAVDLDLYVTAFSSSPPGVGVYAVAPGASWSSGSADAPGDEFLGVSDTSNFDVDWSDRTFSEPWSTPGGDTTTGAALATNFISSTGLQTFSSPALASAVQDWVDADDFFDGLLFQSPAVGFANNGVQFASEDHPNPVLHPTLTVDFEQSSPSGEGRIDPDLADFTDEGEDFRWIYDLDEDGTFVTSIGGVCETISLPPGAGAFTYPYTYSYVGAPGYVGLDCCTWRIFSAESQVVGTGQAIFFHNLDPLDPANLPPDTDGDGILDLCDNCPLVQNGPSLGSCMTADGVNNGPCRSDLECGAGETCDLSQLDGNGDFLGNACAVPEPGLGMGLGLGVMGLALLRRRRSADLRRSWPASRP